MNRRDHTDYHLVSRLKTGDYSAFDEIFIKYSSKIYRFALSILKSESLADDVLQYTFLTIWEKRKQINTTKSFHSYLFTICYHRIIKEIKDNQRDKFKELSDYNESVEDKSALSTIEYEITKSNVDRIIEQLPPRCKKIFVMSRFQGCSHKEIAQNLGISTKTVENQITKALSFLKSRLSKDSMAIWLFFVLFIS